MIRPVCSEDAAALAGIYNYYIQETTISFESTPLSVADMRARIEQVSAVYPFLVWEEAGQVRGYAYAHAWKERAAYVGTWEISIYLAPECCGQGIGHRLLERLVADCRRAGCRVLIACITRENEKSCSFHQCHGFRQVSHFTQVGCKFGRLLDVVDYQLTL
ncbi:MAG: N-acetyltransferase [Akkermansia sp.]|nr:N-acetyltransferase [Akkermansia sp.]